MKKYKPLIAQIIFVIAVACFWQWYAKQRNIMGFPSLDVIFAKLFDCFTNPQKNILTYLGNSIISIMKGLGIGALLSVAGPASASGFEET